MKTRTETGNKSARRNSPPPLLPTPRVSPKPPNGAAKAANGSSSSLHSGPTPNVPLQPNLSALLQAMQAVSEGDFSVRLPVDWPGLEGKIADRFNQIVTANARIARELERVGQVVGRQGLTKQRVKFHQSIGAWGEMEESVNALIDDLLWPTTEVTRALAAVA